MAYIPTPSQTVGPYLHIGMTDSRAIGCIAGPGIKGERMLLTLRLLDGDGLPVPDGMFEVWQADADGHYSHPDDPAYKGFSDTFFGFGRMATNETGSCLFETIKPGPVPSQNGWQAPHLNLGIFGRGLLKRLTTRLYFAGDAGNKKDPVLALVPEDRRQTLMAKPRSGIDGAWWMDVHLSGEAETVFFDI